MVDGYDVSRRPSHYPELLLVMVERVLEFADLALVRGNDLIFA